MNRTLQTLNREWSVSIARNFVPHAEVWPLVLLHSPGAAYAFDSDDTRLDSPMAAMAMLSALGLYELADPYSPGPEARGWHVLVDRPDTHDDPRPSQLRGPHPIAPIGPLSRGPMPSYWLEAARRNDWWCQLMFVSGVDFAAIGPDEVPAALVTAANECRVAGGIAKVHP